MKSLTKYLFIVIGIYFLPVDLWGQEQDLKNLELRLKNSKHDTTLVRTYNEIAEVLYANLPDSAVKIWEKTILLAEKHIASEDANEIKLRTFYKKQLSLMLSNISYIYYQRGELKITLENLERSLKINEELGNKEGIAHSLNGIGYIYDSFGDVTRALEYFHKALKISEQVGNKMEIGISLNNIGYMYDSQDDFPKALECYYQDLKLREEIKDDEGIANSLNNIGTILERQKKFDEALNYYSRSLKLSETHNDKNGIALTLLNIGAVYERQKKYPEAMEHFLKSLKIREELKDREAITRCDRRIAKMYLRMGKLKEAEFHAERGLKVGKELGFPSNINDAAFILKEIYAKENRYKEAFEMYTLQVQMSDSIYSQKVKKAAIKKQFQYAYEKKVAQDSIKHTEEQNVRTAELAAQEAQLKQEKTQRFVLYGGLVLVIALAGFIFNRFKITQKQKEIIELQKVEMDNAYEKLHEKNKEVMDSINYAKRIQNSLFPSEKYISRILEKRSKA